MVKPFGQLPRRGWGSDPPPSRRRPRVIEPRRRIGVGSTAPSGAGGRSARSAPIRDPHGPDNAKETPAMADLQALGAAIEAGDRTAAVRITGQAIDEGVAPQMILDSMTAAMAVVGARFSANEIYVPEMLISARAMKEA